MSNRTCLAMLPLILATLSAAQAQTTVDVGKITCEPFIELKVAPPDTIAIWLNGYHHGLQRTTIVDA
jgi:HdeA/HdeB family protein